MKGLGWIAVGGLAVGLFASTLAGAIDRGDDHHFSWRDRLIPWSGHGLSWNGRSHGDRSCYDGKPDGEASSERRLSWNGSDSIAIQLPATVHYRAGAGTEVIVKGDPEAVGRVRIRDDRIQTSCDFRGNHDLDITLPGQVFREVSLSASAHIIMENLDQPDLELNIGGSGSARLGGKVASVETSIGGSGRVTFADLAMKELDLNVAGSGNVEGTGSSDSVDVNIAGAGTVDLAQITMKDLDVSIAGSGDVDAGPKDKADISIMGSGKVTLLSHPAQLETNIMGSGKVVQAQKNDKDI